MHRRYVTVDVFTDEVFGGNPLAVVLDADGLTAQQMQSIAAEFNYSETTFVLPPRDPGHRAQVRIFTPRTEVPFAGHPNVGTAFVVAREASDPAALPDRIVFEEAAGLVPVRFLREGGEVVGAELTAPQTLSTGAVLSSAEVAACLSLSPDDVLTTTHAPLVASVGLAFVVVEIASRAALRRAKPDLAAFERTLPVDHADCIYFYTRDVEPATAGISIEARMFAPLDGVLEDPATGSATAAACALIADAAPGPDLSLTIGFRQGVDMGRPSLLTAHVEKRQGQVGLVRVGGRCVEVMRGTLAL